MILNKVSLNRLYVDKKLSAKQIASRFRCSENKINYWLKKFDIPKRTISESIYIVHNPKGNPFELNENHKINNLFLFGLGLGLYWGEGNKNNKHAVRLGNTDPDIIVNFIDFLEKIYSINRKKLRFGIQVFNTMNSKNILKFWTEKIKVNNSQFFKIVVTPSRGLGTYNKKIKHGVLTIYFGNKKLRDILCDEIEKLRKV